jgi:hypothetical protein
MRTQKVEASLEELPRIRSARQTMVLLAAAARHEVR